MNFYSIISLIMRVSEFTPVAEFLNFLLEKINKYTIQFILIYTVVFIIANIFYPPSPTNIPKEII